MIFDPLHYLALLEHKPNALDQAAPLARWDLPEGFAQLRRLMEARLGKKGKREYVQTLRLLETFARRKWRGPSTMPCSWVRSPLMRSSIYCYAASSAARRGWI